MNLSAMLVDAGPIDAGPPLPPGAPFEGEITATAQLIVEEQQQTATVVFTVKGQAARWDLTGPSAGEYRVYRADERAFYTVNPKLHVAYRTTEDQATASDAGTSRYGWKLKPIGIDRVGKVADYPCDRLQTSDVHHRWELCAAKGLVPIPVDVLGGPFAAVLPWDGEIERQKLFPLSATRFDTDKIDGGPRLAGLEARYQVTAMVKHLVDPARVNIPAEYTRLDSPALPVGGVAVPTLR